MKLGNKAKIALLSAAVVVPAVALLPSIAGPSSPPLIDKEFETAVRKFVSKRFFNRIDATDEQREKLSRIMGETQDQTRPIREQVRQGLLQLSDLMADEKASDDQIKAKVKEIRDLHEQVQDKRLSAVLEARKILSAEQRKKISNRVSEIITGGIRQKKISMLLNGGAPAAFLNDE